MLKILCAIAAIPAFMLIAGLILAWKCVFFATMHIDQAIDGALDRWL